MVSAENLQNDFSICSWNWKKRQQIVHSEKAWSLCAWNSPAPTRDTLKFSLGNFSLKAEPLGTNRMPGSTSFVLFCFVLFKGHFGIIRGLKISETTTQKIRLWTAWNMIPSIDVEKAFDKIQHPLMVHLTKSNTYSWYKLSKSQK